MQHNNCVLLQQGKACEISATDTREGCIFSLHVTRNIIFCHEIKGACCCKGTAKYLLIYNKVVF